MDRKKSLGVLPLVVSLTIGLMGCGVDSPQAPTDQNAGAPLPPALQASNVQIVNDPAVLESRIVRSTLALGVRRTSGSHPAQVVETSKDVETGVRLTLVGTVRPPVVDGKVVQANDIEIQDHTAIVAYNFAGDVFAGAVQVIDFQHPERPVVVSEVLYRNADVDAVTMQGSHVFVGLASDDPTLRTPALLEDLRYTSSHGVEQTGTWLDMPSWAVTDLAMHGEDIVAAVGARDGGVVLLRRGNTLSVTGFAPSADVRGVDMDEHAAMSVCGGGSAQLLRNALPGMALQGQTGVEGYKNQDAKGTIEVYSHRCYLGAGDGGFQVRGADGALLGQLLPVDFAASDPRTAVVNAVSIANNLAFVACGSQGIEVVRLGRYRCDGHEAEENEGLRILGTLGLEAGASCNMVKTRNNILVVAAGAGGVKLVSMQD